MASSFKNPRDGSALLVGLLVASLLLVAVLAWQAVDAARSHRAVAESLLRDYAQLAADELVRRTVNEVGYYGYYPLLNALKQALASPAAALPSRDDLVALDPRSERALPLARYFFQLDPASGRLEVGGGEVTDAEVEGLLSKLEPPAEDGEGWRPAGYAVRHAEIAGEPHTFAYTGPEDDPRLIGFEVDLDEQRQWFETAFGRGPLLPPSLVTGEDAELLVVRVTDAAYREVFRAGKPELYSPVLSVHEPYGDAYAGIFDGLTVHVSLYPSAAAKLVIGGLPRSRLPFLVVLLVVTSGLLLLAIYQLRRARALERLRSDFVSQVSHELRTPLTQVRMFAETLLLGRVRSEEEGRRSLEIIDAEARRLSHLVENILQFSRSERGALELTPRVRELAPVVRDVVRDFAPLVGGRGVSFATRLLDTEAAAAVDDEALRQILLNLLDNAVKYGPACQVVLVGLERVNGRVRLWVDDEGPGIPARDRRRIWLSFERLERDRRSAVAGTGIGLAVVRQLVELQGGTIDVEAGTRGGARFVVELPAAPGAGEAAAGTTVEAVA